ncbi:putative wall-associated receptor kinase-like 13 [Quercus suber]|uniref:Wall-associated receptor kinase-like 13 n=1 Tax=Quercus suber TaxID=58331 RepID=A0AAW0KQY2_QUESU
MKMAVQFVMRITILVLLTYELAEAEAAAAAIVAKPDCNGSCGNLDIPYPFGIGPHCYMDKMFEVVCNGTGSSVKAYLISIDKEVLQINISNSYYYFEPTVQVQMPIIYSNNCRSLGSGAALNISGSPFNFSFIENTFISVGCYNFAKITGLGPVVFGCETHCNKSKTVERTNCSSGFNCCESSYFPYQQEFHVEFKRIDGSPAGEEKACKYAFLVDQNWLQSNKPDPSSVQYWETVPIVLDWAISKRTKDSRDMFKSLKKRPHVRCSFEDEDEDFYSFACKCAYKYQGNPYLPSGYFYCTPYYCIREHKGLICPSFVLLFLLLIIWWLSKVIKKRNKIKLKQKFFERNGGLLLQQQLSSNENNVQKAKLFNSKELENVTDHFNENRILGKGGQEYFQTSQYTEKSDVYSFGVVLIELLTGEKPVSLMRSQEGRNLSTYFVHSLKENRLFDILDTQVSKVCNKDEVITIANLAKRCLHLNGKKRPTMMEIMMELEGVQKVSPHQPNLEEI